MKVKDLNGTVELDIITKKKEPKQETIIENAESFDNEVDISNMSKDFSEVKHKSNVDLSKFFALDFKTGSGSRYIQKGAYFEEK